MWWSKRSDVPRLVLVLVLLVLLVLLLVLLLLVLLVLVLLVLVLLLVLLLLLLLALVSTGAAAHSRQFASSTAADSKPTRKAFWQRCGRWACIVTPVPAPAARLDPSGTAGCAGHRALAFTAPTGCTGRLAALSRRRRTRSAISHAARGKY
jgi:membrane protein implicated in regulation of membrane protease activity